MATASPAKMKVADLRAALAERGMSTAGLKAELVQRLDRKMAEERRVDVPRGSFGLNSSTPPRASPSSTSGAPGTSGAAFGSPHRHHAEARVTLSPHRHHEPRRGLWGVPMSEADAQSARDEQSRDRVLVLSSALREEQLVVARERDARLADRERRAEAEEALSHARARPRKHDEEVASLREALAHGASENAAVAARLERAFADVTTERAERNALEGEVSRLKQVIESRDAANAETLERLQTRIGEAATQKARAESLREQLTETRASLSDAEARLSNSASELAEQRDKARALAMHDPNPGIIHELEKQLDEQRALGAARGAREAATALDAFALGVPALLPAV